MDSTNQFCQEVDRDSAVQQQQSPANPVAEELNDTELDAIAGGFLFDQLGYWLSDRENFNSVAGKKVR
ncbi:hypothetical protein QUA35_00355 [Microcoleus sp. N9_B2]|uniref:hypothetical protein n=1 Tax=unclassified Microcoleus TaxID=2642155 RepID=UPI002FD4431F